MWYDPEDRTMRRRYPSSYVSSFSFGPGPISTALKAIIAVNVAMFVAGWAIPGLIEVLGLVPYRLVHQLYVWQLVTYMFMHGGALHVAFNMLALWMFGAELERTWGTRYFLKYYFVTGVGAGVLTVVIALLPFEYTQFIYQYPTIGASGAIFGVLLAYGLTFPERPIFLYFVFPIPAKYFVLIVGAISFFSGGGVAHATHLGGIVVGYLFLKSSRIHPISEVKYRYLKWKINRVRKKFDVYSGGRADDWDRRVH
jgi:membrane associated rhomboid family serine protease